MPSIVTNVLGSGAPSTVMSYLPFILDFPKLFKCLRGGNQVWAQDVGLLTADSCLAFPQMALMELNYLYSSKSNSKLREVARSVCSVTLRYQPRLWPSAEQSIVTVKNARARRVCRCTTTDTCIFYFHYWNIRNCVNWSMSTIEQYLECRGNNSNTLPARLCVKPRDLTCLLSVDY